MAVAETGDVILTAETLSLSTWPHAVIDCPSARSSPSATPCSSCFCFVCDIPFSNCDNSSLHAVADGSQEEWRRAKRRHAAFLDAWNDIPALVNLIVKLSVDEAVRNVPPQAHAPHVAAGGASPTYVAATAGFDHHDGKKELAVKPDPDVDALVKGLDSVSLQVKTEHVGGNVYVKQEFVEKDLVDHVSSDLRSQNVVKSQVVSKLVHPGPE